MVELESVAVEGLGKGGVCISVFEVISGSLYT